MTYRHQIPACGWEAVLKHEDGSYSTIPLVCFEILCADEEDEDDFSHYEPENSSSQTKPKKGSAIEAVGLAFLGTHPQEPPSLVLSEVHTTTGFMGYLPPGESLEEWLNHKCLVRIVNPTTQEKTP